MSRIYTNKELRIKLKNQQEALQREKEIAKSQLTEAEREFLALQIEEKYHIRKYRAYDGYMYTIMPEDTFKAVVDTVFRQLEIKKILALNNNLSDEARVIIRYLIEPDLKINYHDIVNIPCVVDLKEP